MVEYQYEPPFDPLEDEYPDVDKRSCQLLGPTALVVQALMGIFVIFTLVYKRQKEKPMRPWRIWMFDVSKQVAGQMFVHGLNLFISDTAADHSSGNPCVLYFLNILIDTTFGVGFIYLFLRTMAYILIEKLHLKGFQSGQYGEPPSFLYWARQAAVYVLALTFMKLLVVALFVIWPGIFKIGAWLLTWTGGGDAAQVVFVMGIFPIVMNVLQFWLIDSIVKASATNAPPRLSDSSSSIDEYIEPLFNAPESDEEDEAGGLRAEYDIENQRGSSAHTSSRDSTSSLTTGELKDTPPHKAGPVVVRAEAIQEPHSYPPIVSSSPASVHSSLNARRPSLSPKSRILSLRLSPPPLEELPLRSQSRSPPEAGTTQHPLTKSLGSVMRDIDDGAPDTQPTIEGRGVHKTS